MLTLTLRLCALQGAVQVKLELGHRAQVRKKPTVEGFTHDWMVFVRGPEHSNIQHFVEKVVFHLHESFPKPKVWRWGGLNGRGHPFNMSPFHLACQMKYKLCMSTWTYLGSVGTPRNVEGAEHQSCSSAAVYSCQLVFIGLCSNTKPN
uniref:YEATS domain-containing protein n=1 Tax=Pundamilia nyererei TaxID=303518 RepID=A0A3B4H6G1_9CICH